MADGDVVVASVSIAAATFAAVANKLGRFGVWGRSNAHESAALGLRPAGELSRMLLGIDKPVLHCSASIHHIAAVTSEKEVVTAGCNDCAQLGTGGDGKKTTAVTVPLRKAVTKVCASNYATTALTEDGEVLTWGRSTYNRLGRRVHGLSDPQPGPVDLKGRRARDVETRAFGGFAVTEDGVLSWGSNGFGELGADVDGQSDETCVVSLRGSTPPPLIWCGDFHIMAYMDGRLFAWGRDDKGQLGVGCDSRGYLPAPVPVRTTAQMPPTDLALSDRCSAVVDAKGHLYLCGEFGGSTVPNLTMVSNWPDKSLKVTNICFSNSMVYVTVSAGQIFGLSPIVCSSGAAPSITAVLESISVPPFCVVGASKSRSWTVFLEGQSTMNLVAAAAASLCVGALAASSDEASGVDRRYREAWKDQADLITQFRRLEGEAMLFLGGSSAATGPVDESLVPTPGTPATVDTPWSVLDDEDLRWELRQDGYDGVPRADSVPAVEEELELEDVLLPASVHTLDSESDVADADYYLPPGGYVTLIDKAEDGGLLPVPAHKEALPYHPPERGSRGVKRAPPVSRVLVWLRGFPSKWLQTFADADFHSCDVSCDSGHDPRWGPRVHNCCVQNALTTVFRRATAQALSGAPWAAGLQRLDLETVREGAAAAVIYSAELMYPRKPGQAPRRREHQLYATLNKALRGGGTAPASVRRVMAPLATSLRRFIEHTASETVTVFRGLGGVVSSAFECGTSFSWCGFSSTSALSRVALSFASSRKAGTLFVVGVRNAADVSWVSMYQDEREVLVRPTTFRVCCRLPESLLVVLETNNDIVIAVEEAGRLCAEESVALRLRGYRQAGFVFDEFRSKFVPPRVSCGGTEKRLFTAFADFLESDSQVMVLFGDGGTGKTTLLLAVISSLLRVGEDLRDDPGIQRIADLQSSPSRTLSPVFVHLPWAPGLMHTDAEGAPLVTAIQRALQLQRGEELEALKKQRVVFLLDSLDECPLGTTGADAPSVAERLAASPLLKRGGVDVAEWPGCRFVVACRTEFVRDSSGRTSAAQQSGLFHRGAVETVSVEAFDGDEQLAYVGKVARKEVAVLLRNFDGGMSLEEGLSAMRCIPPGNLLAQRLLTDSSAAPEIERSIVRSTMELLGTVRPTQRSGSQMFGHAFMLFMCVEASRVLHQWLHSERQWVTTAPRAAVYKAWLEVNMRSRIARSPDLQSRFHVDDLLEKLHRTARVLAAGMFVDGQWCTTVGRALDIIGRDSRGKGKKQRNADRQTLSALPLRIENVHRDSCTVSWRHRTVQEYLIACVILEPGTAVADLLNVLVCSKPSLDVSCPVAHALLQESAAVLHPAERKDFADRLRLLESLPGVRTLLQGGVEPAAAQPRKHHPF
eukprot:TRINITY_DN23665_c0_g1_i1.p1 TRINITY_DN23665_c0_g1~~TRINITY_DN23665_c0_g1_i1.p1  ORF type:complete len:1396 (+),score=434.28 TRINITY_DN23665_c0_g1_i1:57-4190(+)